MNRLEEIRKEINKIDEEMLKLFEKRMKIVEEVIAYKIENNIPILDTNREEQIIKKNSEMLQNKELLKYYKEFLIDLL